MVSSDDDSPVEIRGERAKEGGERRRERRGRAVL